MEQTAVAPTDRELVEAVLLGDTTSWETLAERHQTPMFRLVYLLLGDEQEAEDIAQEALWRAYRQLQRFDRARPFRPWLLSIAANLAKNRRRSLGRYLQRLARVGRSQAHHSSTLEERVLSGMEAEALYQAVQQLRPDDREIIYLRYFLELSVEDAAQTVNIAEGTVKSRLHRALKRLRGVIEDQYPLLMDVKTHG
jgi:RNA polymerase sigma-70 factor (ECF subfamily)